MNSVSASLQEDNFDGQIMCSLLLYDYSVYIVWVYVFLIYLHLVEEVFELLTDGFISFCFM